MTLKEVTIVNLSEIWLNAVVINRRLARLDGRHHLFLTVLHENPFGGAPCSFVW